MIIEIIDEIINKRLEIYNSMPISLSSSFFNQFIKELELFIEKFEIKEKLVINKDSIYYKSFLIKPSIEDWNSKDFEEELIKQSSSSIKEEKLKFIFENFHKDHWKYETFEEWYKTINI